MCSSGVFDGERGTNENCSRQKNVKIFVCVAVCFCFASVRSGFDFEQLSAIVAMGKVNVPFFLFFRFIF